MDQVLPLLLLWLSSNSEHIETQGVTKHQGLIRTRVLYIPADVVNNLIDEYEFRISDLGKNSLRLKRKKE